MRLLAPLIASALFVALNIASPAVAQVRIRDWNEMLLEGPLRRHQWLVRVIGREASREKS